MRTIPNDATERIRKLTVSVVTASFNADCFLEDCLASVQEQQSLSSPEHIVIDGGSTDGTVEILQGWLSSNSSPSSASLRLRASPSSVLRFLSEPDKGQSDAFNKGVSMASGEWICWLNADDMLAPGAVTAFQKALAANPDADVIYGHVQFIQEDSSPAWISYHLPFFYPLLFNGCYVPPSSGTFFRRDLLLREPLDIDYHYVMDVEWFLRCGRNLRAVCVDQVLSHFRISSDAKTSEMIRSGKITDQHYVERENYRRKYIYSQWPTLTEEQARNRFHRRHRFYLLLYNLLKLRYAWRYFKTRIKDPRIGANK